MGRHGSSAKELKGPRHHTLDTTRAVPTPSFDRLSLSLHYILYHSKLAPTAPVSCVSDIIKTARGFNAIHGLSGVLMFDGQHFMQYLEGPKEDVWKLLVSIAQDPRHVEFKIQDQGECAGERLFTGWSMGYALVNDSDMLGDLGHLGSLMGQDAMNKLHALVPMLDIA